MSNRSIASPEQCAELHAALVRQCPRDIDSTTAQKWIENQAALQRVLREALMPAAKAVAENIFKVTVDYSRSLAEMIAAGKYDWINQDFTEKKFPIKRPPAGFPQTVELTVELVHYNKWMGTDAVNADFKQRRLIPAAPPVLLAVGEQCPELQRQFPIVALGQYGQFWGDRHVPYLWSYADERYLGLDAVEGGWLGCCRFLGVRES